MNRFLVYLMPFAALSAGFSNSSVLAQEQALQESAAACTEAARLIEQENIIEALEEAQWCVESLQQIRQKQTLSVFPDTVKEFAGGEIQNQSAMGMTILERTYNKGDQSVNVALTSGVAGGGLAALAQLGLNLGGSAMGEKIRVQRRTVINMSQTNAGSAYMVQLKSGGMLNIKSDSVDESDLLEFVRAFPIADLDEAL
ncbi:MAG: hypothetical protein KTR32_28175 [Granulosicoccus sp.]|nr:hypothetical protein [Granulosicoccus sp.]